MKIQIFARCFYGDFPKTPQKTLKPTETIKNLTRISNRLKGTCGNSAPQNEKTKARPECEQKMCFFYSFSATVNYYSIIFQVNLFIILRYFKGSAVLRFAGVEHNSFSLCVVV